MFAEVLVRIQPGVRILVAVAFVLSVIVATTYWAVREKKINAFGAWARFIRRVSDPLLGPVEQRVTRAGGNPQDAPLWLVGLTLVAGLILIAMVDWLLNFGLSLYDAAQGGAVLAPIIHLVFEILKFAIIARVLASWFNPSRHSPFMRIVYVLTDWIVEPLQKIIPPVGMLDFSALVAYLVLSFAESVAMRGLF